MEFEEIDELYKKWCDDAHESFLKGMEAGADKKILTQQYHDTLKKNRERYYKMMGDAIKQHRAPSVKKKTAKKDEAKTFRVEPAQLKLSFSQKFSYWFALLLFNTRMKYVKIKQGRFFTKLSYLRYKFVISFRSWIVSVRIFLKVLFKNISKFFLKVGGFFASVWNKIVDFFAGLFNRIFGRFMKKKEKSEKKEGEEKTNEGEQAIENSEQK